MAHGSHQHDLVMYTESFNLLVPGAGLTLSPQLKDKSEAQLKQQTHIYFGHKMLASVRKVHIFICIVKELATYIYSCVEHRKAWQTDTCLWVGA